MRTSRSVWVIAATLAVAIGVSPAWAGGGCGEAGCCDPGCDGGCSGHRCCACGAACAEPVCCLVKTEKEVVVECYGVKCKDICVPCCGSGCGCTECVTCGQGGCNSLCGVAKAFYGTGKPGCAKPKSVKVLVKYEMTKKVPAYKQEVKYFCGTCAQKYAGRVFLDKARCDQVGGEPAADPRFDQAYNSPPLPPR